MSARKQKFEERIEAIKDGPKSSPFYNFCLSVIYLHKAAVAIKFNEMWSAGWDAKKAYQYIKDNNLEQSAQQMLGRKRQLGF